MGTLERVEDLVVASTVIAFETPQPTPPPTLPPTLAPTEPCPAAVQSSVAKATNLASETAVTAPREVRLSTKSQQSQNGSYTAIALERPIWRCSDEPGSVERKYSIKDFIYMDLWGHKPMRSPRRSFTMHGGPYVEWLSEYQ